ncbi:MAG: DUF2188 domain-containing protein [Acholeplasmataceae bacterium]
MGLFSFLKKKKPRKEVQEVKEVRSVNEVEPGIAVNDSPTIEPNIISAQSTSINEQKPVVVPVEKPAAKAKPKTQEKAKVDPKPSAEDEKAKAAKPSKYHVSQNKDAKSDAYRKWRVRKEGSQKTIKYFDTQKEAIAFAEDLAESNNSSVVVHKLDGTIRKQNY